MSTKGRNMTIALNFGIRKNRVLTSFDQILRVRFKTSITAVIVPNFVEKTEGSSGEWLCEDFRTSIE